MILFPAPLVCMVELSLPPNLLPLLHLLDMVQLLNSSPPGYWAICSTYHTVLKKASPGAAIFGWDVLFDIPFLADWNKIGDYRQSQTRIASVSTVIIRLVTRYSL